jgi:hypothetical protein
MPLVAADLATLIAGQLSTQFTPSTAQATNFVPQEQWMELATAIANAVVPYIQANALVVVNTGPGAGSTGTIT